MARRKAGRVTATAEKGIDRRWLRELLMAAGIVAALLLLVMLRDPGGRSFIYAVF